MKKVCTYLAVLGMMLTMIPNLAAPAASAYSQAAVTVQADSQEKTVYKDVTDAPVTSVSVAALNGKWVYDDVDITFSDGTVTSGKFTMDHVDGTKDTGTVKLQYTENAKGEKDYFFVLYNSDGKLNMAFKVNGTIPLEELYTAGEGSSVKFVRVKEAVKGDVTGDSAVSVEDAQLALTAYVADMAGLATGLSEQQTASGDINGDKKISVEDAQLILLYYVKNTVSGTPTTWEDLLK